MIFPHNAFIRIFLHSAVLVLFIISLLSGIRLAFDNPYMSDALLHSGLIPQGNMMWWHELSAYGWLALVAYVSLEWLKVRRTKPKHYQNKNRFIRLNYIFILAQVLTGLVLYINQLLLGISALNGILLQAHYFLAAAFFIIVIAHITEQIIKKSYKVLLMMFMPKNFTRIAGITLSVLGIMVFGLYYYHHHFHTELIVKTIPLTQEIRIDGKFDEPGWQDAKSVTVLTAQGNNYFESVPVEIKMLQNGLSGYFAIRWPDPTPSYSHLPLVKTRQGWQVQHDGFEKDDERTYYEDKMAVMLSQDSGLAGGYSVHLGKKPLNEHPKTRSNRGYHYTTDDSLRDIWHWKAVRVKRMSYLDDNHFGAPSPACEACPRYKGGYRTDPKDSGSFRPNWTWFLKGTVTPLRLPIADISADEASMSWFDTVPYDKAKDDLPLGATMPSVLTYEGFEGDRANVAAKGIWKDGYWHLELARNLKHDSKFDLALQSNTFLWFAPFDHAQSRHGYHLKPVKLVMESAKQGIL